MSIGFSENNDESDFLQMVVENCEQYAEICKTSLEKSFLNKQNFL